ncbi:MAG: transposase [Candidatus Asgardarchaeum californiense]|nr:MAG: transposase [Candidatus Asgardarchaeum californiense]
MTQTTVINKINDLKYKGFKEAYLRQIEDVNYHSLTFEDRLYNLLDSEYIFLQNKRIIMNSRLSRIKDKQAMVEEIEYTVKRNLNKAQILSLITMDFIRAQQNIIITGKTGTGKSYLAQALGNRAIIDGFTVYYIRIATLLEDIKVSRLDGSYTNLIKKFARYKLLIIDDFGVSPISSDDTTNLFEIIEVRSEQNSTIITSQLPVKDWYGYLNNNTAADAILDRIASTSHRIELEGESMRKIKSKIDTNYD